jgi:hypothetical protein
MQLGASPGKLAILAVLGVVVVVFLIRNLTSDDGPSTSSTPASTASNAVSEPLTTPETAQRRATLHTVRRKTKQNENTALRLRPIDARKGNIDPTLRLDLLARLRSLPFAPSARSLFDAGPEPVAPGAIAKNAVPPIDPGPKPPPLPLSTAPPPPPPIPLKFYGFIQPKGVAGPNRGFFLEGDNILVGAEGQVLMQKYKIVQLSASTAVMEDTTSNNRQTLTLVPEAQNAM